MHLIGRRWCLCLQVCGPDREPPVVSARSLRPEHVVAVTDHQLLPLLFANVLRTVFEPRLGKGTRVEYHFPGVVRGSQRTHGGVSPRVAYPPGQGSLSALAALVGSGAAPPLSRWQAAGGGPDWQRAADPGGLPQRRRSTQK